MLSRLFPLNRCYASSSFISSHRLNSTTVPLTQKHTTKRHLNQAIVDLLLKSLEEEELKPDVNPFKLHAFSKAIESILTVDHPIRSGNDVHAIPGIGPGIIKRINEHLLAQYAEDDAKMDRANYNAMIRSQAALALETIPSIGRKKASQLAEAGCFSLDDLMSGKYDSMLSAKQTLMVKYASNLQRPILRQDAEETLAFCRHHANPKYQFELVGDYRRGLESFTDIEIMVSHPSFVHVPVPTDPPPGVIKPKEKATGPKPRKRRKTDEEIPPNVLHSEFIPFLEKAGIVSSALSTKVHTWKGIVRLPGPNNQWGTPSQRVSAVKRVEGQFRKTIFYIVPQRSVGSGLLSLTGNARFENYLRYRARQKGMLLNEHGIWRWTPHQKQTSLDMPESSAPISELVGDAKPAETSTSLEDPNSQGFWSLIKSVSEEDFFRELGLEYLPPTRRNFTYAVRPPKDDFDFSDYDYLE